MPHAWYSDGSKSSSTELTYSIPKLLGLDVEESSALYTAELWKMQ